MKAPAAFVSEKFDELEVLLFSKHSRLPLGADTNEVHTAVTRLGAAARTFGDGSVHNLMKQVVDGKRTFLEVFIALSNIVWKVDLFLDFSVEAAYFQEKLNFLLAYRDPKDPAKTMHTKLQFQALVHELTYACREVANDEPGWSMFVLRIGQFIGFMSAFLQRSRALFSDLDVNPFQDLRQHLDTMREKCDRYKDYIKMRNIVIEVWLLIQGEDVEAKIEQLWQRQHAV